MATLTQNINEAIELIDSYRALFSERPPSGITEITLPKRSNFIPSYAFCDEFTDLQRINNTEDITIIAINGFRGLDSTPILNLPSLTSIGENGFYGTQYESFNFIDTQLLEIGDHAFQKCVDLTEIYLPSSLEYVGYGAFFQCESLTDIYYAGTQAQWESISGIEGASIPQSATIHYSYTPT